MMEQKGNLTEELVCYVLDYRFDGDRMYCSRSAPRGKGSVIDRVDKYHILERVPLGVSTVPKI